MRNFLTITLPKYGNLGICVGGLGIFAQSIKDNAVKDKLINQLDDNRKLVEKIENLKKEKGDIIEKIVKSQENIDINENINKITGAKNNLVETINNNASKNIEEDISNSVSIIVEKSNKVNNVFKDMINKYNEILNSSNNSNNNLLLEGYFDNIKNSLSNLTYEQLGAIVHISGSLFILFCLFTIISIIYGDRLIIYFNLEEKFPKLAKYIQLRRKYLEFNLILNITLIILVLLSIIYINMLILLS
jgi:hypothetical protein